MRSPHRDLTIDVKQRSNNTEESKLKDSDNHSQISKETFSIDKDVLLDGSPDNSPSKHSLRNSPSKHSLRDSPSKHSLRDREPETSQF